MSLVKVSAVFRVVVTMCFRFNTPCPAGFDFHFGSLDNEKTELARQYENVL
jgi:hypothetical protein